MPYADLHFHLLPGVDDGPADMDASLELARAAVAEGTGTVVTSIAPSHDLGYTVKSDSQGRLVVAGYTFVGGTPDIAVARYH